jgi:HlyD family secretion protein
MTCVRVVTSLALIALVAGLVSTQPPAKDKGAKGKPNASADKAASSTLKLEKKPFKIALTLPGILAAEEATEISYRPHPLIPAPQSQGPLAIRSIAAHGGKVAQGDLLVAFDTSKLDAVIADTESEARTLDANLRLAEEELPHLEKSAPAELAAAETAKKHADEDLKYFLDVGRAERQKQADFSVKSAKYFKEYAEEELQQLEKMYKANDLTESTEKIILRRQQHRVELATYWYQTSVLERDHLMKYTLPQQERTLKETQVKQDLHLARTQKTLAPTLAQKHTALAKMRADREKTEGRLEKLRKDRASLTINAPSAGIVYYGKFHKGQWTGLAGLENKLVKGGSVSPEEVFLTVVKPRPVVVHVTIDEKDVYLIKAGLEGKAKVPFHPERRLSARVSKLAAVPASPGKFDADVALELGADDADLLPGMACSIHFVPYSKQDAIVVPSRAIYEEADKYFVDVLGKKGQPEKREVTPGRADGDHTEITDGLRSGEEIFVERPAAKPAAGKKTAEPEETKGTVP